MKRIWMIFKQNVLCHRGLMLVALGGGALFCLLYWMLGGLSKEAKTGGIPVGLLDMDGSALSADFRDYLEADLGMVLTGGSYEELSTELIERHISAIIEVPDGFEEGAAAGAVPSLTVTTLDDYANAAFLQSYLDSYMASLQLLSAGAAGDAGTFHHLLQTAAAGKVAVSAQSVTALTPDQIAQREGFLLCMGFFLMLSFMVGMGLSNTVFDDRTGGLYQRIKVSAVSPGQYVAGISLYGLVNVLLFTLLFFLYVAVFGFDIGRPLGIALLFCLLYGLFVVGFCLTVGMFITSKNAILALIIGTATITCLLGGAYFPIETSPEILQKLARLTPHFWFMDALRGLQASPDYGWGINAAAVGLFALLSFLIAAIRFSQRRPVAGTA